MAKVQVGNDQPFPQNPCMQGKSHQPPGWSYKRGSTIAHMCLLSVELGPLFSVHSRVLHTLYVWQQRTWLGWALMSLPLRLSLTFLCLWLVTWEMAATSWRIKHGLGLTPRSQVSWVVVQRCQPSIMTMFYSCIIDFPVFPNLSWWIRIWWSETAKFSV